VLNGGYDRWRDEGGAADVGDKRVSPGRFEAGFRADVSAETVWIAQRIEAGDAVLLDTRTPAEFAKGHLPGALSWDWFNAVPAASWGVSRDPEELRAEWHALGLDPSDDVTCTADRECGRPIPTWCCGTPGSHGYAFTTDHGRSGR
jgi:3-mercaptopyruvate sulfurtransferase SseA